MRVGGTKSGPGRAPGSAPGSVLWHGIELDDLSGLIESVTPEAQVISLLVSKNIKQEGVDLRGAVAAQANLAETVFVRQHMFRLAFALTAFKLQGRTLPKLIIHVALRKKPPWMTLNAFYVLISRVRTSASLRLLQIDKTVDSKGLTALTNVSLLKHDELLVAWECGYDNKSRWSDALALAGLKRVRLERQQAKQARADAKKAKENARVASKRKAAATQRAPSPVPPLL